MTRPPNLARRQAILTYIAEFQRANKIAPSNRNVAAALKTSPTNIRFYLRELVLEGRLTFGQDFGRRWYEIADANL